MRTRIPSATVGANGTAGRPHVPSGSRVYAVGDIHGRADLLDRLLEEMAGDLASWVPRRAVVVFLGDYVDRGPESRRVVERLASGPPSAGPLATAQWVALRGNHEDYVLRFLSDCSIGPGWFLNGGLETVRSYIGSIPPGLETDTRTLQRLLAEAMPPDHVRFLSRLPLSHTEGDYLFVHAGVRPGVPLARQDPQDMMWIRDEFLHSREAFGKVVVHGHSALPTPEMRPNRISVDTGAWRSGRLTALVLEGADRRFLRTRAPDG